jgi:hypothetical protein
MGPMAMLNRVKLVTLETCQMYGMRTIFVIDASPAMENTGPAPPRAAGSWAECPIWPLGTVVGTIPGQILSPPYQIGRPARKWLRGG